MCLPVLVHKLAVEPKGKLQDGIPVSALYVKNAIVLQMESMQNKAFFLKERGTDGRRWIVDCYMLEHRKEQKCSI